MITRAYPALYHSGTPSQETGTSPPSCQLLENRLHIAEFCCRNLHQYLNDKIQVAKQAVVVQRIRRLAALYSYVFDRPRFETTF